MPDPLSLRGQATLIADGSASTAAALVDLFRTVDSRIYVAAPEDPHLDASWVTVDGWGLTPALDAIAAEHDQLHALILEIRSDPDDVRMSADRAFDLVEAVKDSCTRFGAPPRHIVVLSAKGSSNAHAVAERLLATLTRYLSAQLATQSTHLNLVVFPPTTLGRQNAARSTVALCSGWMDGVKGQRIEIEGEE